jgi:hypothetical protein
MQSQAKTVEAYLDSLEPERREAIRKMRELILENLPPGYEEAMNWGMITYQVPLEVYPDTYNKQPLMAAALASQKNHMAVYLTCIYTDEARRAKFEADYRATGKRYDVGKSCVRFRKLEDLPLDVIREAVVSMPMEDLIELAKKSRSVRKGRKA